MVNPSLYIRVGQQTGCVIRLVFIDSDFLNKAI